MLCQLVEREREKEKQRLEPGQQLGRPDRFAEAACVRRTKPSEDSRDHQDASELATCHDYDTKTWNQRRLNTTIILSQEDLSNKHMRKTYTFFYALALPHFLLFKSSELETMLNIANWIQGSEKEEIVTFLSTSRDFSCSGELFFFYLLKSR